MCAKVMPDIMLRPLHALSHLIPIMALQDKYYDCFHFVEAESYVIFPG